MGSAHDREHRREEELAREGSIDVQVGRPEKAHDGKEGDRQAEDQG